MYPANVNAVTTKWMQLLDDVFRRSDCSLRRSRVSMTSFPRILQSSNLILALVAVVIGLLADPVSAQGQEREVILPTGEKIILKTDGTWKSTLEAKPVTPLDNDGRTYEDSDVRVTFKYVPGELYSYSFSNKDREFQHILVTAFNKSPTKIASYQVSQMSISVSDNFGNHYSTSDPRSEYKAGAPHGVYPGESRSWKLPITVPILRNAESLKIMVFPNVFGNQNFVKVKVDLNGDQISQIRGADETPKRSGIVDGNRYEDDSVSIEFEYQPNLLRKGISAKITNVSQHKIVTARTHGYYSGEFLYNGSTDFYGGYVAEKPIIRDNFGNGLKATDVIPNLAKRTLGPGQTAKATILFAGRMGPGATAITVGIKTGFLGNSKSFEATLPIEPGGQASINYSPKIGIF